MTTDGTITAHHAPKLEEVHESPLTMLVPLGVLALGAVFAGMAFFHYFIGEGASGFWRASLFVAGTRRRRIADVGRVGAARGHHHRFPVAYYYYILHPDLPRKLAAQRGMLYTVPVQQMVFRRAL